MYALKWTERLWHCAAGYLREVKPSGMQVGEKAGAMEFVEGGCVLASVFVSPPGNLHIGVSYF